MGRIEQLTQQIQELENKTKELQEELEAEKQKTEIEYPFEESEEYWGLDIDGELIFDRWTGCKYDEDCFEVGNMFKTAQEAKKERDKRILLTRFRQFRDKCNGEWEPESEKAKYYIFLQYENFRLRVSSSMFFDSFNMFGYFKNCDDAELALELFGDDIKRLWVECE